MNDLILVDEEGNKIKAEVLFTHFERPMKLWIIIMLLTMI